MMTRYDPDMVLYEAMQAQKRREEADAKSQASANKLLKRQFFEDMSFPLFMDFLKGKKKPKR